jgi:hypothetical protein
MSPEIGQAATRLALFMIIASVLVLLWVHPGSAEFVAVVLTIVMGLLLLVVVAVLARLGTPRWTEPPHSDDGEPPRAEE